MSDTKSLDQHSGLMDNVYSMTRHVYDATRKYYLFGRDKMIRELDLPAGASVCEVGCGTGRNLIHIGRAYPGAKLYGIDASNEMLKTARQNIDKAGQEIDVQHGFAETFESDVFAEAPADGFDAVVFPYSLSMIPDWQGAITNGVKQLKPGGKLVIVDFGLMGKWPGVFRAPFQAFLKAFHVSPRAAIEKVLGDEVEISAVEAVSIGGGYAQLIRAQTPAA